MSGNVVAISLKKAVANNAIVTVPEGFQSASLRNLGDTNGAFSNGGNTWTLLPKEVFNFPEQAGNKVFTELTIDGTGTEIECAYL